MLKSLWIKFLILLLGVSIIALSSALVLRELMIKDFREYLEGEMEDRVYWVMADIEGTYEKHSRWEENTIAEDAVWALMLGLEIKIKDAEGNIVIDTEKAVSALSPLIKRRIMAVSNFTKAKSQGAFQPYPLFLKGKEIGTLEVRFLRKGKESIFIDRSNRFLLSSLFALGGLAIVLSIIFSRKLTNPIKRLVSAAKAISEGNLKNRVKISDKDEIGKLSETFNLMAKNLEMQESLRKKLISNIAHELRTPISAMRGELEGMVDGLITTDKEQLRSLYEETGRLKNLLDGIDELSQAQASALSLRKQHVELNQFLKNIIERFSKLFEDKGIALEFQCDDGLLINADPDKLSQIVINLLSNALKATYKNGIVRLIAGKKDAEVFIEVSDTGRGIKKDEIPFIFERFFKAVPGGLGLGLAIVKELVDAHDGRIEVKSEYGKGAAFTVYLPV
ncbi:MAG: ATP-binding protein [Thermodesulfovibrionales bacterium]|nr:ATP-binding protein [Thermodesulfovibrionales bacterium]